MRRVVGLALVSVVACVAVVAHAQDFESVLVTPGPGEEATAQEFSAWMATTAQPPRWIDAREEAELIVAENPDSYVGHFVLGRVHHWAEANFPKALYHTNRALQLFEAEHGEDPDQASSPWLWHARIVRQLAITHGDLEHHEDKLRYIERYNESYGPRMIAERSWPLMKLGQYDAARRAAEEALAEGDPWQTNVALNALCAIEFEAGNDGASYDACRAALEFGKMQPNGANAVDYTNFAEAARSMFLLEEAERASLSATEVEVAAYANPWIELSDLYVREGRFAEALEALKKVPPYRAQREPLYRNADRNEGRRALAAFFLVVGRPDDANRITDKALVAPDRRAHNSRDPNQDLAIVALMARRAHLMAAEVELERAAARPFWENGGRWLDAIVHRFDAWTAGRQASRLLADDDRLVGIFRIGTNESAVTPPWLVGELVDVMGAGVVSEAVRRARTEDDRELAPAYYDAFEAEAALSDGDEDRAIELGERALSLLPPAEVLLRARVKAVIAVARGGYPPEHEELLTLDPGIVRRFDMTLPVRVSGAGEIADDVADAISWSPRFEVDEDAQLEVRIDADAGGGEVCLLGATGAVLACADAPVDSGESPDDYATRLADAFHEAAFAPRIDLSQTDVTSLEGSNRLTRDPLEGLLEATPAEDLE